MYVFLSCTTMEYKYNRINMLDNHLSDNRLLQDKGEPKGLQLLLFSSYEMWIKWHFFVQLPRGQLS